MFCPQRTHVGIIIAKAHAFIKEGDRDYEWLISDLLAYQEACRDDPQAHALAVKLAERCQQRHSQMKEQAVLLGQLKAGWGRHSSERPDLETVQDELPAAEGLLGLVGQWEAQALAAGGSRAGALALRGQYLRVVAVKYYSQMLVRHREDPQHQQLAEAMRNVAYRAVQVFTESQDVPEVFDVLGGVAGNVMGDERYTDALLAARVGPHVLQDCSVVVGRLVGDLV